MTNLSFVVRLGIVDPDNNELHSIDIYRDDTGRLIGLDSFTIAASENALYSPYNREEIALDSE